jgi:hypothetical protein
VGTGAPPARGSTTNLLGDVAVSPVEPVERTRAPSLGPTIGASIAARPSHGVRNAVIALVVLGLAATAITLAVTTGQDQVEPTETSPAPPPRATGTVKFTVKPADAMIKVAGLEPHAGSPWQTELAAGQYQLEIQRDGYKTYLAPIELSAGETQTQVIQLEQIGETTGTAATSTLIVDPSTPGLEVVLDDVVLDRRTPLRMDIEPGPHVVALRQDGVEVWSEEFTATANATHKFDPSMSDDKKRERRSRRERERQRDKDRADREVDDTPAAPEPRVTPPAIVVPPPPGPGPTVTATVPPGGKTDPIRPDPTHPDPARVTTPVPPVSPTPTPTPTPPPPSPAPKGGGPELVPPNAVSKISGSVPSLETRDGRAAKVTMISAKVCIDTGGRVTSANVLSKLPDDGLEETLEMAIRSWRYAPYKKGGAAASACFIASFRTK